MRTARPGTPTSADLVSTGGNPGRNAVVIQKMPGAAGLFCVMHGLEKAREGSELEQFTHEMRQLFYKDLSANPCHEMRAGGLCSP